MSGRRSSGGQRSSPADSALLALGEIPYDNPNEQSWHLTKLPDDLNTVRVLRKLDLAGYIVRGYTTGNWASPEREPRRTSSWEHFVKRKDEPGFAARIRLTGVGKDRLDDLREGMRPGQTRRKPGRPPKPKHDKVRRAVCKMLDSGDVERYGRKWKGELLRRYADQLPKSMQADSLRKLVEREEARRAADKK